MKLSTKTISSLMVAVKDISVRSSSLGDRQIRKIERVLRRHDRKGDLRASILGIDAAEYREQQRHYSLEELVKKYGFEDIIAYFKTLYCKLRHELRCRGWSMKRIQRLEMIA